MTPEAKRAKLRSMLAKPDAIPSFAAHDAFTALVMQSAGIPLLFLGGFGASASLLGAPDVGVMTLELMTDHARRICTRIELPIVVDGDTGFGDAAATVRALETAGAAGVIIEDQTEPKRCGHFDGKSVVQLNEMLGRIEAAVKAKSDPNFLIVARTDARAEHGMEEAMVRANACVEIGADVIFVEAPQTETELAAAPPRIAAPCMANMLIGGVTPVLTVKQLQRMGYRIVVSPIEALAATMVAIRRIAREMLADGRVEPEGLASFDNLRSLLEVDAWLPR